MKREFCPCYGGEGGIRTLPLKPGAAFETGSPCNFSQKRQRYPRYTPFQPSRKSPLSPSSRDKTGTKIRPALQGPSSPCRRAAPAAEGRPFPLGSPAAWMDTRDLAARSSVGISLAIRCTRYGFGSHTRAERKPVSSPAGGSFASGPAGVYPLRDLRAAPQGIRRSFSSTYPSFFCPNRGLKFPEHLNNQR